MEKSREAKEYGIDSKVRFIGTIEHAQVVEYYKIATLLLHTSYYESEAMAVAEAMASGVLVCGTHVGLMADLSNSCCITVPSNAPELLAESVLKLLSDQEQMNSLRLKSSQWSVNNSLDYTYKIFAEMYLNLMRKS
jgi:glycosyltransferase involved in cell wall biosynthesis